MVYRLDINNNKDISDIPLSGNPQISYFTKVFRKHTDFRISTYIQKCSETHLNKLNHMGDLVKSISLEYGINTPTIESNIGTSMIDYISLYASDNEIERLSGSYIENYMQLKNARSFNASMNSNNECLDGTMEQILSLSGGVFHTDYASILNISIPIPFSFSSEEGSSIPIFLFHKEKPLQIKFSINEIAGNNPTNFQFRIDYIILTEDEKLRFMNFNNEYLYETIKEQKIEIKNILSETVINNTYGNIKSIMWNNPINSDNDCEYNISVNNYKLFNYNKSYHYFTRHTIFKSGFDGGGTDISANNIIHDDSIAYYSFALIDNDKESPMAPTGSISCNKNKISFISKNNGSNNNIEVILYVKSYNIININNDKLTIKYAH